MRRLRRGLQYGVFHPQFLAACLLCGIGLFLLAVGVTARPADRRIPVTPAAPDVAAPQPTWSVTPSANIANNTPAAVTCVNDSDCWSVGSYIQVSFTNQTLVQHWNGTRWSIVPSPNVATTENNNLSAITCVSTSDCWAVGEHGSSIQQTLIEHWNGSVWSIVSSPNNSSTKQNYLAGVACSSSSDCWAVGFQQGASANQTLIEHWNGIAWSIVTSPNSSATESNGLNGVTCVAANDCWTVGSHAATGASDQTLTAHWNGTAWTITTSPNTSASQQNVFTGVTCTASSNCWATGAYDNGTVFQTLAAQWNGTAWTIVSSPNSSATVVNGLLSVTCVAASDCWSVGVIVDGNGIDHTLAEHWNGSVWSIVSSPNAGTGLPSRLQGIACTSGTSCWAVGYSNIDFNQSLTEKWNGASWSIVASPNVGLTGTSNSNSLSGITCTNASDCWAVGRFDLGNGVDQTLTQHWDGTMWSIFSSPNTAFTQQNELSNVTCLSSNDCWVTGDFNNGTVVQPLIEHWNGNGWTVVSVPSPDATHDGVLLGITCTSTSDCWAVGVYINGSNVQQTLIERWNGMNWSIVSSPNTDPSQPNRLNAVTCTSSSDCWAVGNGGNGVADQTLIAHWNGVIWSAVNSANTSGNQDNYLNGVTCTSATNCWAVGAYDANQTGQTLTLHWNGSAWSVVASPNAAGSQSSLNAVTCTSTSDCVAVGESSSTTQLTLIEQWNGTSWVIASSPNPAQNNYLNAIACASASDCFGVGNSASGGIQQTLVEKRTIPLLRITSVARPTTGPSPGQFIVTGVAVANAPVTIFASPDLTNFGPLNTVSADSSGNFQYTDAGAATIIPPRRFYRAGYQ